MNLFKTIFKTTVKLTIICLSVSFTTTIIKTPINTLVYAQETINAKSLDPLSKLPFNIKTVQKIKSGEIFSDCDVEDKDKTTQEMKFIIAGIHPRSCKIALNKISRYEKYSEYMDFIKDSKYDEANQKIFLLITSKFLPVNIVINFKLERITSTGIYHFQFDQGFLKDLHGEIHVDDYNSNNKEQCLFFAKANWTGPNTKFPNTALELFTSTLSYLGLKTLFRISK